MDTNTYSYTEYTLVNILKKKKKKHLQRSKVITDN